MIDEALLVELHKSRDIHAESMRKMFGSKNIQRVQEAVSFPHQLSIPEFCLIHDELKRNKLQQDKKNRFSFPAGGASAPLQKKTSTASPIRFTLLKAVAMEGSGSLGNSNESSAVLDSQSIDRVSSSSLHTTPTSSPAMGPHTPSLPLPPTSEPHPCLFLPPSRPLLAKRSATIEKMILEVNERQQQSSRHLSPKVTHSTPSLSSSLSLSPDRPKESSLYFMTSSSKETKANRYVENFANIKALRSPRSSRSSSNSSSMGAKSSYNRLSRQKLREKRVEDMKAMMSYYSTKGSERKRSLV